MSSPALEQWRTARAARLDELVGAHRRIGGQGAGRRWDTEQINWALVLRLATEFQGFARDIHSLAADVLADWSCGTNAVARDIFVASLTLNRQIDQRNATPSSLGADFGRFGLKFWDELKERDRRTESRQFHLECLNEARNAIVHDEPGKLEALRQRGYPLTLKTIRRWRGSVEALASTMDLVIAQHLAALFGRSSPW